MELNFFGWHMRLWKLHSAADYAQVLCVLAAGLLALALVIKRLGGKRTDAYALERVCKKLRRMGGRDAALVPAGLLPQGEGRADVLYVSRRGVFALRCLGWGYRVSGSLRARQWRVGDAKEERFIANPYAQAVIAAEAIAARLSEAGIDVPVRPLIVFADPFEPSPRFSLEGGSHTIGYSGLKLWHKALPKTTLDAETAAAAARVFAPRKA